MPRVLPSSIQLAISKSNCQIAHLLTFSVGENTYRYSEDERHYQGNLFQPGLRITGPIRYSEQLQVDPVVVSLQNISLETAALLQAVAATIQGQEATLERLYLQAVDTLLLFRGRIGEIQIDEQEATLTLITEFDPLAARIPTRQYSALCAWNFTDSSCGYAAAEGPLDPNTALPFTSCPKDFLSCEQRGRQHRFSGFPHLTREVSETIS